MSQRAGGIFEFFLQDGSGGSQLMSYSEFAVYVFDSREMLERERPGLIAAIWPDVCAAIDSEYLNLPESIKQEAQAHAQLVRNVTECSRDDLGEDSRPSPQRDGGAVSDRTDRLQITRLRGAKLSNSEVDQGTRPIESKYECDRPANNKAVDQSAQS